MVLFFARLNPPVSSLLCSRGSATGQPRLEKRKAIQPKLTRARSRSTGTG